MNIGIIVHSQTGNTKSVAEVLSKKLQSKGHVVTIELIVPDNEQEMDPSKIKLDHMPDLSAYEGIIFACPVRGFNVSGAMHAFILGLPNLDNRKTALFVTHFFPFAWMGGTPTINKMKSLCKDKNGNIIGTGIINWKRSNKEQQIEEMTSNLASFF